MSRCESNGLKNYEVTMWKRVIAGLTTRKKMDAVRFEEKAYWMSRAIALVYLHDLSPVSTDYTESSNHNSNN